MFDECYNLSEEDLFQIRNNLEIIDITVNELNSTVYPGSNTN